MTKEELFREFQSRIHEKRNSLNKSDCPEGYAFEEYQEGWRSAFSWATDILAKLISEQPPLPSDVDEVSESYGRDTFVNECMENGVCDHHDLADAFKAGAEWMAGQYEEVGTMPLLGEITTLFRKK